MSILVRLATFANAAVPSTASRRAEAALMRARLERLTQLRPRPIVEAEEVARRRWERVGRGAA